MSTPATIKTQLRNLIDSVNLITGNSDSDLTSAVNSLIAGYHDDYLAIRCNGTSDLAWEYESELVTNISAYAFYYAKLTKVICPNCTSLEGTGRQFQGCLNLVDVQLQNLKTTGECAFMQCTSIENLSFPQLNSDVKKQIFMNCSKLQVVDLGKCNSIGANVFNGCTELDKIVLRNDTVVTLANVNAFTNTKYTEGGSGGNVYVPSSLLSSYQQETNWSVLYGYGTCKFVSIEGSEFE